MVYCGGGVNYAGMEVSDIYGVYSVACMIPHFLSGDTMQLAWTPTLACRTKLQPQSALSKASLVDRSKRLVITTQTTLAT